MRIAVIQLPVAPTRRTLTLHRALQVIDDAARADPAPDLILLPAFCDVPAVTAGHVDVIERLAGQTVAACSWRARHWGVFIALGLAEQGPKGLPERSNMTSLERRMPSSGRKGSSVTLVYDG